MLRQSKAVPVATRFVQEVAATGTTAIDSVSAEPCCMQAMNAHTKRSLLLWLCAQAGHKVVDAVQGPG
eukprot:6460337-Amphidinium_carterae.2